MATNEWALIGFTILAQMAFGAFVWLQVVRWVTRHAGAAETERLTGWTPVAISVTMVLSLIASFLHLGAPLNAPWAVANIGSSWLSREIAFALLFTGLVVLYALWPRLKAFASGRRSWVAGLAIFAGVGLMIAMPMAYASLEAQPVWNTTATPLSFLVTALLLGTLAVGAGLAVNHAGANLEDVASAERQAKLLGEALRWTGVAAVVLAAVELAIMPISLASVVASGTPAALQSIQLLAGPLAGESIVRLILVIVGAGVLGVMIVRTAQMSGKETMLRVLASSAFLLVLIAEVVGRYVFYASRVGIAPHPF